MTVVQYTETAIDPFPRLTVSVCLFCYDPFTPFDLFRRPPYTSAMKVFGFTFGAYARKSSGPPTKKQLDYIERLAMEVYSTSNTQLWRQKPKTIDEAGEIIDQLKTMKDAK